MNIWIFSTSRSMQFELVFICFFFFTPMIHSKPCSLFGYMYFEMDEIFFKLVKNNRIIRKVFGTRRASQREEYEWNFKCKVWKWNGVPVLRINETKTREWKKMAFFIVNNSIESKAILFKFIFMQWTNPIKYIISVILNG